MNQKMESISSKLTKDMNKGIAGASALAGIKPLDYDPADKLGFGVGYGHHKDVNTTALGAFYYANPNLLVNVGTTIGSGSTAFNAGVSFKVGQTSEQSGITKAQLAKDSEALHKGVDVQNRTLESQNERLDRLEQLVGQVGF